MKAAFLRRQEALALWLVWLAVLGAACWFVGSYGLRFPFADEMEAVPWLLGEQPITYGWLWSQHCDHRLFLPRLIYLGLAAVSGNDLRMVSLYNALALGAAAAFLLWVARRVRGQSRIWDACLPLALLHWGHYFNLIWGFQLCFVTSVALSCVVLGTMLLSERTLNLPAAAIIAICLSLMSLCGAFGIVFVPAVGVWMGLAAWERWRNNEPGRRGFAVMIVCLAMVPLALVALYFHNYALTDHGATIEATLLAKCRASLAMLSTCLGDVARKVWPVSGLLILAGLMASAVAILRGIRKRLEQPMRHLALGCFLGGLLVLALAIGWGRAALSEDAGFADRYYLLAAPLVCVWFLLAVLHERDTTSALGRRAQVALCVTMCVVFAVNARKGYREGRHWDAQFAALERDIHAGLATTSLARRYGMLYPREDILVQRLESLQKHRFGAFAAQDQRGPLRKTFVEPLSPIAQSAPVPEKVRIEGDQSCARRFSLPAGRSLSRIDVQIARGRQNRRLTQLQWSLSTIAGGVTPHEVSSGLIELANVEDRFVSLRFPALQSDRDTQLELTLRAPDEASGKHLELPLFPRLAGDGNDVNALLFVQPTASIATQPANTRR